MSADSKSLILVIGAPRSGTTVISRAISQHSRVSAIIEPYQRRRNEQYSITGLGELCRDFGVADNEQRCVLVKETFTRRENVDYSLNLVERSIRQSREVLVVLVLRSPVEAFLSQTKAARERWAQDNSFGMNSRSLRAFMRAYLHHCLRVIKNAANSAFTVCLYDDFCEHPREETRKILSFVGLEFEDAQIDFSVNAAVVPFRGGDPCTREKKTISKSIDIRAHQAFEMTFGDTPIGQCALRFQERLQAMRLDASTTNDVLVARLQHELQTAIDTHFPEKNRKHALNAWTLQSVFTRICMRDWMDRAKPENQAPRPSPT